MGFDPKQPRDKEGQWSKGGGGSLRVIQGSGKFRSEGNKSLFKVIKNKKIERADKAFDKYMNNLRDTMKELAKAMNTPIPPDEQMKRLQRARQASFETKKRLQQHAMKPLMSEAQHLESFKKGWKGPLNKDAFATQKRIYAKLKEGHSESQSLVNKSDAELRAEAARSYPSSFFKK